MKKSNLTIISRRENITAKAEVNGNTVTFGYEKQNNQVQAVAFSVVRGIEGSDDYTGVEAFRGSMYGCAMNIENNAYQLGDSAIYEEIYKFCKEIMEDEGVSE